MSGNVVKEEHPVNRPNIFSTFSVFHLEISGSDFNEDHPANKQHISTFGLGAIFMK